MDGNRRLGRGYFQCVDEFRNEPAYATVQPRPVHFLGNPGAPSRKTELRLPRSNQARTCTDYLDPLSDRLMYRLQYRNFGIYQSILATHSVDENGNNHAGVRWYELRNTGSGWSIYQQSDYAPDSDNRWMGSIAQDSAGNIALCYSVSSITVFPSIRCTIGWSNYEMTIKAGTGSQLDSARPAQSARWGDYSALQIDPSDDTTFWYTNEYYQTSMARGWITRIASFTLKPLVTYGLSLASGWNLISLPLVPLNPARTFVLGPLITSNNLVIVWSYNAVSKSWVMNPTTIVDGVGYWIYLKHTTILQLMGYVIPPASPPPTYSLVAGWNLAGFKPQPTIAAEPLSQYLTSITGKYDPNSVWLYNNVGGSWIRATATTSLAPGQAIWILMAAPGTLRP